MIPIRSQTIFILLRKTTVLFSIFVLMLGPGGGSLLWAGGALAIAGPSAGAREGEPYIFSVNPLTYHVDGGPMAFASGSTVIDNASGILRVNNMFQKWGGVTTSALEFVNGGDITITTGVLSPDGDVDTLLEIIDVTTDCFNGLINPIIFDADGSLFSALGLPSGVIGFAGPCSIFPSTGRIPGARAVMNGKFQDGLPNPSDLTADQFNGAFIHEFGHLFGMDHSQINVNCLGGGCASESDDAFGLPTMFPFLVSVTQGGVAAITSLSEDDKAWVSMMYPETVDNGPTQVPFSSVYGKIEGTVLFSDGTSHAQGVNVIARKVDDGGTPEDESRRFAVSNVSGWRFVDGLGQSVTGTNPGQSFIGDQSDPARVGLYEIPIPAGEYTVEVEQVFAGFIDGSGVGPLADVGQLPLPGGTPEFHNSGGTESSSDNPAGFDTVSVTAGITVSGIDIILNGTDPRFDQFESARVMPGPAWPPAQPLWQREDLEDDEFGQSEEVA